MGEFAKHGVYEKVPTEECWRKTGAAPIGTRWVDVNKGDDGKPEYRSRLVAKEIKTNKREDLFAATPPLEAQKTLLSLAMTEGIGYQTGCKTQGHKLDFIDVRRAYFHAKARREVYVELPQEDHQPGMCGKLSKSMYGTRDAAQNWEHAYMEFLENAGFRSGTATPCVFHNRDRDIRAVVHGDDFTVLASENQLDWFRREIVKRFEVKFRGRLGPEQKDDKSIRVLNRVVEWTVSGIMYEADQRHAEIIVQELGLTSASKPVNTPSQKAARQADAQLSQEESTMYRALVARANYLAQDRADICFAVKELCKTMSKPCRSDWDALKRLGRYLIGKTRLVVRYDYQSMPENIDVIVDTDFAGCPTTRKSTSGGIVKLGEHCVKAWSSNQAVIALSSGEAEFYGIVKGASNALGITGVLNDLGVNLSVAVSTDSSAAKGIANRRGLGKVRHIELSELWVQDQIARGRITVYKIDGSENSSDSLTKHSCGERIAQTLRYCNQFIVSGRHEIMPEIAVGKHC